MGHDLGGPRMFFSGGPLDRRSVGLRSSVEYRPGAPYKVELTLEEEHAGEKVRRVHRYKRRGPVVGGHLYVYVG